MSLSANHKYLVLKRLPNGSMKPVSACEELTHAQQVQLEHEDHVIHVRDDETGEYHQLEEEE